MPEPLPRTPARRSAPSRRRSRSRSRSSVAPRCLVPSALLGACLLLLAGAANARTRVREAGTPPATPAAGAEPVLREEAATAAGAGTEVSQSALTLTSFTKDEANRGEVTQLWLTLANPDAAAAVEGVRFDVYLPHEVTYLSASVFPALPPGNLAPTQEEDDALENGQPMTRVRWPVFDVGPKKSHVFNLEVRIEGFDGDRPLNFIAEVHPAEDTDADASGPLARINVVVAKKRPLTSQEIAAKRAGKLEEVRKWAGRGSGWRDFKDCAPRTELTQALGSCFEGCYQAQPPCVACGYDAKGQACVCQEVVGQPGRRLETYEDVFKVDAATVAVGKPQERKAEILIFPNLLSEATCKELDAYLESLVRTHKTPRRIQSDPGSLMHRVAREMVPLPTAEYLEWVTYSKEEVEVAPHYDNIKGDETHKLLVYLDGVAGTRFWETRELFAANQCPLEFPASRGTVVLFPMSLFHDSQAYVPMGSTKSTLGLRAILPEFEGSDTLSLVAPPGSAAAVAVTATE